MDLLVLGTKPTTREEMARRQRIELPSGGGVLEEAFAEDTVGRVGLRA